LSYERIFSLLTQFGLSQREAQIYLYLAREGPQQIRNISQALKSSDNQVYRSLKNLSEKQIVFVQKYPPNFSAAPFEEVLEYFRKGSLEDAKGIEEKKSKVLLIWRSMISNYENDPV
jgi:sugar-specific transcriptional regulator TrmB